MFFLECMVLKNRKFNVRFGIFLYIFIELFIKGILNIFNMGYCYCFLIICIYRYKIF